MTIEQFHKTQNEPIYFSIYYRIGGVLVSVTDIRAKDREDALKKAKGYLTQVVNDING